VDDPDPEKLVVKIAEEKFKVPATATHQISQLYGLKARTRTAAINASMLVKMMETANMTEYSIKKSGIQAPLMIMRSDGGIMDIEQMRRRPILTMLSGPAAGVAAALMYVRISDGVFLEVGGTSTDISVIRNGKALVRTAQIGGQKIYVRTLDVRTEGVAGGSMIRLSDRHPIAVGPRSAHIAGYHYSSFAGKDTLPTGFRFISPLKGDPEDYVIVETNQKESFALTPTCLSNFLGFIQKGDYSFGNLIMISRTMEKLAEQMKCKAVQLASEMMDLAVKPVVKRVEEMIKEYELDPQLLTLTGGGGGAKAIVPYTGKVMKLPVEIAENAEVISAIGAALAMVRETIEKTVINPTPEDLLKIKQEATESVMKMGALPETIEVQIELEPQKNIVRGIATGSTEFRTDKNLKQDVDWPTVEKQIADNIGVDPAKLQMLFATSFLKIYAAQTVKKKFMGLFKSLSTSLRIVDSEGIVRLQLSHGDSCCGNRDNFKNLLTKLIQQHIVYGDAGQEIPDLFVLYRRNISDYHGLTSLDQLMALLDSELSKLAQEENIIAILDLSHR